MYALYLVKIISGESFDGSIEYEISNLVWQQSSFVRMWFRMNFEHLIRVHCGLRKANAGGRWDNTFPLVDGGGLAVLIALDLLWAVFLMRGSF